MFGVEHRFNDGFTYGQSFWLTVCSTAASTITNVTIIVDFVRTPDFAHRGAFELVSFSRTIYQGNHTGSGLTRKQRALMIIVIILLVYIAFGALVNSLIQDLHFIDGLYFTVVTIETIGFGDIHPMDTGSKVFTCFYMAFGILIIGVAVAMTRETVLEGLELGYMKRVRKLRLRRHEARRFRHWETRWRRAVEWRLRAAGEPVWVSDDQIPHEEVRFMGLGQGQDGAGQIHWAKRWLQPIGSEGSESDGQHNRPHFRGHPRGKHLNIDALSSQQLEAAALEAGVPLQMFLSPPRNRQHREGGNDTNRPSSVGRAISGRSNILHLRHRSAEANGWPTYPQTPSHAQVGRMAAMITKFAMAVTGTHVHMIGHAPETQPSEHRAEDVNRETQPQHNAVWFDEHDPRENGEQDREDDTQPHLVAEGSLHPNVPEWAKEVARGKAQKPTPSSDHFDDDMAVEEKRAYYVKVSEIAHTRSLPGAYRLFPANGSLVTLPSLLVCE